MSNNTIDTIFTQAAAKEGGVNLFHYLSVPVTLSILSADLEIPLPTTTDPTASVEEVDTTLDIPGGFAYIPSHIVILHLPNGIIWRQTVAASFVATLSGLEDVEGHGTSGKIPGARTVNITITQTNDPTKALVSVQTSDSLAHISALVSRSEAPVQLVHRTILSDDQPGYSHETDLTVTLTLGDADLVFREPVVVIASGQ